ncbi:RND efflux system, outer membrane lipoprotein, NodT family [Filimonas lacunae]|nr:RND efflux system, outer membrane lipoprotein, NodT family [Filimonas lacunae]
MAGGLYWTACSSGKATQTNPVALPAVFDSSAAAGVQYDTAGIAAIPWQSFFADATLRELISKAIAGNFDLQTAYKRTEAAQQQVLLARAAFGPSATVQAGAQISRPSDNSLNGLSLSNFLGKSYIEDYTLGLNLGWEADIWGKLKGQKEAALASYLQTYEGSRAVQTRLIVTVAEGYYNLLMLEDQLNIARKNLELANQVLKITRLQRDAGEATTLAIEQAEVQQQTTALLIPQLEQAKGLQENALRLLTGELPGSVAHAGSLNTIAVSDTLSTGLPARMVKVRPDVRAAEMALQAANARVGVAKASMYPALNITASGGLNSFKASNWFSIPSSLFGLVGGSLAQPLLQKRQLKTQLATAKINRETAVIEFRQAVVTAVSEVSDAMIKIKQLKQQQVIAQAKIDTLQKAMTNADMLFKAGMANYLEVINVQSNKLQAELAMADITRQRLTAVAALYRALGGGN